ncbi:uncharacterized protein [Mycetomoellerius zeteki]|uniref:uncharacterized protein n=1 Tax=Mycetomoellerius zeteki TaxID=64791 RepID=UPI00084EB44A|nr:PREDICTED: uncharacterized protein LOC108725965 [Trachymyrmex zeteki]
MAETEAGDNLIPVRRWIRRHYTKLTRSSEARCNHCNEKFSIHLKRLATLYNHLIEGHPDKLIEEEKNEVKFHWAWDYYIVKSSTEATCKQCKVTVRYKQVNELKIHLKRIHGMSGPTSDNVIDNESSSDEDMDANKDVTLRKATRQDTSSNLTNLSDSLNESTEGIKGLNKEAQNDFVPVRLWMRAHYTKLNNEARCIHCNRKFIIHIKKLSGLHKHLVESHPDKLAEEEKNEVKFQWAWDYYIVKSSTEATCKQCKVTVRYKQVNELKIHLKRIHGMSGPTSDNAIDNESSLDEDMDANKDVTLRKATRQDTSSNLTNLSDSLNESTEGIKGLNKEAQNDFVPVRLWMRAHYTKLNNEARCIHCNRKFIIHIKKLSGLHKHLVESHPDKLAEEQKNEVKFQWVWDYYIVKSSTEATCKQCKVTVRYKQMRSLRNHLKRIHGMSGPTSDNAIDNESSLDEDMDANKDVTLRKAKRPEASSNLTNLSDSLNESTEGIKEVNEEAQNDFLPFRLWMREHYTKLTRCNEARCNHCNEKFNIDVHQLAALHKHLIEAHPDKLAEEEKNEVKFHWAWDYYIVKSRYSVPGSDNHMDNENNSSNYVDADRNTTIKEAKYQEDLSNSIGSCSISYEKTGGTECLNE